MHPALWLSLTLVLVAAALVTGAGVSALAN